MRQSVLRELAVQSLQATEKLEDYLDPHLVERAGRENITVDELIRERLLLKAGASTVGALVALVDRVATADRLFSRNDGAALREAKCGTSAAAA